MAPLNEAERAFLRGDAIADFAADLGRHVHVRLRRGLGADAALQVRWLDVGEENPGAAGTWLTLDDALVVAWGQARWRMGLTPGAGGFATRIEEDLRRRLACAYAQAWLDGNGGQGSLGYQVTLQGTGGTCRFHPTLLREGPNLSPWARALLRGV